MNAHFNNIHLFSTSFFSSFFNLKQNHPFLVCMILIHIEIEIFFKKFIDAADEIHLELFKPQIKRNKLVFKYERWFALFLFLLLMLLKK